MQRFTGRLAALGAAAMLSLAAASAHASLVPLEPEDFNGTGLGSVFTILTIDSPASSTFESGSVAFGDVTSGDVKTGESQTQTWTLGEIGVSSASDLRVVFNALEPDNRLGNSITLADLVLTIYDPTGAVLFTSGAFSPIDFPDTETGAGNAGFVFGLDAEQQAAAAAAFGEGFENNVVGLSATAGCNESSPAGCQNATGGFETFFVGNSVTAVPEPSTYALILAGIGMVGFMAKRRSRAR